MEGKRFPPAGGEGSENDGLFGTGEEGRKVEVLDMVEFGCTGPKERREELKSGSRASLVIVESFVSLACGGGCTLAPVTAA